MARVRASRRIAYHDDTSAGMAEAHGMTVLVNGYSQRLASTVILAVVVIDKDVCVAESCSGRIIVCNAVPADTCVLGVIDC